jgi:hypothetical protein
MIDVSRVTKDDANGLEPAAPRILARQLARPLTDDEIDHVAGGMISRGETGGVNSLSVRHTPTTASVCPGNDADE